MPAPDRQLRVFCDAGAYHPQPEWCENIPHPVEQSRGQAGSGDAYSPGWFELPLAKGANVTLVATAETEEITKRKAESGKRKFRKQDFETAARTAPRDNSSSAAVRAKRSSLVIRGFWIGGATR